MRPATLFVLAPLILFLSALRGDTGLAPATAPTPGEAPAHAVVARAAASEPVRIAGRCVPSEADELRVALRTARELVLADVLPHGSVVNPGDRIARFETRALEREIARAERDLAAAERAVEAAVVTERLATRDAERAGEVARREEQRAQAALDAWRDKELAFERRARDLEAQSYAHAVADAEEELRQLEAMYRDDELVEATEEIVLARSRRDLASLRAQSVLAQDRRVHQESYADPLAGERLQDARSEAARALERLEALAQVQASERAAALEAARVTRDEARATLEDLRADRAQHELVAGRAGVVLHGGWDAWGAEGARPEHRVGDSLPARKGLFLVARADHWTVAAAADPALAGSLAGRGAATVESAWGARAAARLEIASQPLADGRLDLRALVERPLPGHGAGTPVTLLVEPSAGEAEVLLVPLAAVHGSAAAPFCWVAEAEESTYRRSPVELGAARGADVEVRAGLAEGQRVLLAESSATAADADRGGER